MSDRNREIVEALHATLGRRFYEAHCEWMLSVFGSQGVVCADWDELKPDAKFPYIELAELLMTTAHIERHHLLKKIDFHG